MDNLTASKGDTPRSATTIRRDVRAFVRCGCLVIVFISMLVVGLKPVAAWQESGDRVIIERKGSSSRVGIHGRILDYTGEKITVVTQSGSDVQVYSAEEVVSVETPQTEPHIRGLMAFSEGHQQDAVTEFGNAMRVENRTWVRREILAMLVRCALRQGDYASAGSRFLLLVRSDPVTRHYNLIPLAWTDSILDPELRNEAISWLNGKLEVERLLGAGTLLADREYGRRANTELSNLATCTDTNVRLLARAQLWRTRLREGNLRNDELNRWESRIGELPETFRGGPYFLLGRGYLQRRQNNHAATALLWLPLVYDHDHYLAARSCLEAAHALFDVGRQTEAVTLYREVTVRFAKTPSAKIAKELLDAVTSQKN